jgi:malate dehydrogenase (oxaloacetate-decarboxylating)
LLNALDIVDKSISNVRITFIGGGASNVACTRLIFASGANPALCRIVDSHGLLHPGRTDIEKKQAEFVDKWRLCQITNAEGQQGGAAEALRGADVVIALSTPGPATLRQEWIASMAREAIVFACANPIPEIWPWEAQAAGAAVVATGRSDFPNRVNNSLGFPGIFRGALDARAKTITDEMCVAAAHALADRASECGLRPDHILPTMDDWEVFPREAAAVAEKAVEQGLAGKPMTYVAEYEHAASIIRRSRDLTQAMMREGFIREADSPGEGSRVIGR